MDLVNSYLPQTANTSHCLNMPNLGRRAVPLSAALLWCWVCLNLLLEPQLFFASATAVVSPHSESAHPTQVLLAEILTKEKQKLSSSSTSKNSQCPFFTLSNIFDNLQKNSLQTTNAVQQSAMITTPCLDSDSFGNTLSDYIESRICSNITGYHFIAISPIQPSRQNPFNVLPEIIYNPNVVKKKSYTELKAICQCTSICHEHEFALWHSRAPMVRDILRPVFDKHRLTMMERTPSAAAESITSSLWRATPSLNYRSQPDLAVGLRGGLSQEGATATSPLIPDVAIHYRCGDNTVGHYGYLAFPAFKRRIPRNASSIYVMAESPSRKTNTQRTNTCNAILNGLFEYLKKEFSSAHVMILRGANMYDDMTRLALADTTICSVSSFCIWPALASTTRAYFPITRLIAKATAPPYTPHFQWLDMFPEEAVLPGVKAKRMDNTQILKFLHNPKGFRPVPPQYVLDKMRGKGRRKAIVAS